MAVMSGMLFAGGYEDRLNAMGADENARITSANKHRATFGKMKIEPKTSLTRTEFMNKVTTESKLNKMGEADNAKIKANNKQKLYMESASVKSAKSAKSATSVD